MIFTGSLFALYHTLTANNVQAGGICNQPRVLGYPNSKFCVIATNKIFGEKLKLHGITSNCYHPHGVKSNLLENIFQHGNWLELIASTFISTLLSFAGKVTIKLLFYQMFGLL